MLNQFQPVLNPKLTFMRFFRGFNPTTWQISSYAERGRAVRMFHVVAEADVFLACLINGLV